MRFRVIQDICEEKLDSFACKCIRDSCSMIGHNYCLMLDKKL